jgi:hypothetical protein
MAQPSAMAVTVAPVPFTDAKLAVAPSRSPKAADSYAGFISAPALSKPGTYRATLLAPAWTDVIKMARSAVDRVRQCARVHWHGREREVRACSRAVLRRTAAHDVSFAMTPN